MTNKEKLEELKRFLDENSIKYHVVRKKGALRDLFVPKYCISVHISDDRDREFFEHNRWYNPIFIRDEESADFIVEKMQSTIFRVLQFRQSNYEAHQRKLERKKIAISQQAPPIFE